ncbi:hypothetical protein HZB88_04040 [archaeon]|nr:hypothetical protein [archaeon]
MQLERLLYIVGGIFAFAAIVYFTYEYILSFPKEVKTVLLVCLIIIFFSLGEILRGRDM